MIKMSAILALALLNLQTPAAEKPAAPATSPIIWGAKAQGSETLVLGLVASTDQVVPITDPTVCWKEVSPCPYSGSRTVDVEGLTAAGKKYTWKLRTFSTPQRSPDGALDSWDVVVEGPKGGKVVLGNSPYIWSFTESNSDSRFSRYKVQVPQMQSATASNSCPVPVQCP
jgi:hypothetical protein